MPGLKGYGMSSLKNMCSFYEEWSPYINRQPLVGDFQSSESLQENNGNANRQLQLTISRLTNMRCLRKFVNLVGELDWNQFVQVPFTHHTLIISKRKSFEERALFIHECAIFRWNKNQLTDYLNDKNYTARGSLPNNFAKTILQKRSAKLFHAKPSVEK